MLGLCLPAITHGARCSERGSRAPIRNLGTDCMRGKVACLGVQITAMLDCTELSVYGAPVADDVITPPLLADIRM